MNQPRNTIANALFAVLQGLDGTGPGQYDFETFSRATLMWTEVPPASQPAGFLLYLGEDDSQPQAFGAPQYPMKFLFFAYFQTSPGQSDEGEAIAMTILDTLCGMAGKPGLLGNAAYPQTLGNLVINAWVDGAVRVDTGVIDQQMVLIVPITVLGLQ